MILDLVEISEEARRKTVKVLYRYCDIKLSLEVLGNKYPTLVPRYYDREVGNRDLPILRELTAILEECKIEEGKGEEYLHKIYEAMKIYRPEILKYQSTTESSALQNVDEETVRTIEERVEWIRTLEKILEHLSEEKYFIIKYRYLEPPGKRKTLDEIAKIKNMGKNKVTRLKKEALDSIAIALGIN
ncbi:hypothetical protein DNHGIG_40070 [Collibacillus ludicampi]|uniref:RNA polymerase sigma-70 region 4 domain-containing protein n=1 Tax=Collibacillus ludicampi TaxID=2771369 RepID=A0AAV4LKW5_9BACL|nr:hypothetical protein [Collibacillus ludicampi]GIM48458.1 hypothetical protein DNHGIG_40070 [Collibacillus ludicampi]